MTTNRVTICIIYRLYVRMCVYVERTLNDWLGVRGECKAATLSVNPSLSYSFYRIDHVVDALTASMLSLTENHHPNAYHKTLPFVMLYKHLNLI